MNWQIQLLLTNPFFWLALFQSYPEILAMPRDIQATIAKNMAALKVEVESPSEWRQIVLNDRGIPWRVRYPKEGLTYFIAGFAAGGIFVLKLDSLPTATFPYVSLLLVPEAVDEM